MNKGEIFLAGGCFWGTEKFFSLLNGVLEHEVGYANGSSTLVTYREVCAGSGHAEVVRLVVDFDILTLKELLSLFLEIIDPFSLNRQGNDVGVQYRSGVNFLDRLLLSEANEILKELNSGYHKDIVIETGLVENYCKAEEHHQDYLVKNPGGYCHIGLDKFIKALEYGKKQ